MFLTLYSKPGCHLCDEARALLDELAPDYGFALQEINIEEDAAMFERYRYEIPVITVDGHELIRGRIAESELASRLRAHRTAAP